MNQTGSFVESSRLGIAILSGFAVIWAVAAVGLSSVPLTVSIPIAGGAAFLATAVNVLAARREFAPTDEDRTPATAGTRRRIFIWSNLAQAVLFSVLISICLAFGQLAYIPLVGSVIVGGHLIPIGVSFAERSFTMGGILLVAAGALGLVSVWFDFSAAEFAAGVVSIANAVLLLGLAGWQIPRHRTSRT